MPGNKKRLYIALYPSGVPRNEERRYHWVFLTGPKGERGAIVPGMHYHVKNNPISGWAYEEKSVEDIRSTNTLLARIVIAKVGDEQCLIQLFRNLTVVNGDPSWRCRSWIKQALVEIAKVRDCVGTSELNWATIESFARQYVAQKTAEGRYASAEDMLKPKPTYDLLQGREIVS